MDQGVGLGEIATRAQDRRAEATCDSVDHEIDDIELGAIFMAFAEFRKGRSGFFSSLKIKISDVKTSFLQKPAYKSIPDDREVEARTAAYRGKFHDDR